MKRSLSFLVIALLCGLSVAMAYSWTTPSHPKTARAHALDASKMIKQWMLRAKDSLEVDNDRFPDLIKQAEILANEAGEPGTTALLHSMLAEMYQHHYEQNRWQIDRRTPLQGYVPEDIREWSANLFEERIQEHLKCSLQPDSLLQTIPSRTYQALLTLGEDSPKLRPTLFEFLAYRALELRPSTEIYTALIAFQNREHHTEAALLTELEQLRFLVGQGVSSLSEQQTALKQLYREHRSLPYAAEILIALYETLDQQRFRTDPDSTASLKEQQWQLCQEGIRQYPNYPRTAILRNYAAELAQATLQGFMEQTAYPGKVAPLHLTYKQIEEVTVRLYESKRTPEELAEQSLSAFNDTQVLGRLVSSEQIQLSPSNSYTPSDTLLPILLKEPGLYICRISAPSANLKVTLPIHVSRLIAHHRDLPNKQREICVTDWETGQPIPHAQVNYYGGQRHQLQWKGKLTTDQKGLVSLPDDRTILAYQATLPNDNQGCLLPVYPIYANRPLRQAATRLTFFTDRKLYRPGQTLFFKGIAYSDHPTEAQVIAGEPFQVTLFDANQQEVAKQQFTTNEFGSFQGAFTLPKQGLSGTYRLTAGQTHYTFQVETYKRPSFHAEILPLTNEAAFGDSVTLQGKAESYAGVALTQGKVIWRILRRPFWGFRAIIGETQIAEGETTLERDGRFQLTFCPQKPAKVPTWSHYERYELIASVTDSKGETEETRYAFSVGETSLVVMPQLPDHVEKEKAEIKIALRTLNGESYAGKGTYILKALHPQKQAMRTEVSFQEGEVVLQDDFESGKPLDPTNLAQLPSGRYRLIAEAADSQGRICRNQTDFTLYSRTDKRPPYEQHTWLLKYKTECLPGEAAEIVFGTSDSQAHILHEWFQGDQRIHQEWIKLSQANRTFRIPFQASYGEGIVVTFTMVREGELFVHSVPVSLRLPDRQLTIKPITFRDHLQPGHAEHWQFRLTHADSLTVEAEALASLYDASLDQLMPFAWERLPLRSPQLSAPRFTSTSRRKSDYAQQVIRYIDVPTYTYDALNWFGLFESFHSQPFGNRLFAAPNTMRMKSSTTALGASMADMAHLETAEMEEDAVEEEAMATPSRAEQPALRTDFAETAFFYPSLQTDSVGDLWIDFTLPESNTTWKFQLFSHTKGLRQGLFSQEIVSSKPLMITPNLPRFVRRGDEITIRAQVANQSQKPLTGRASIELFDPATNQPVLCLSKAQQPFQLEPDSIQTVAWHFTIPASTSLLGVRIVADSETASDGEQHLLPILSDQVLLTESQPIYLRDAGEKEFIVKGFSKGQTPHQLTFELTANPIWFAVQALSALSTPASANSLDLLACYYTNTLATQLARSQPRIQQVIAQWQAAGGNAETLQATLARNEELKNILLEETPWVMEAQDEATRKQRLSLLFDLNRAADQRQAAMRQLQKLQDEQGGFPWFKGFPASRAITSKILEFLAQLTQLNAVEYDQDERTMIVKALRFLDRQIEQDYDRLRRYNKQWMKTLPSNEQVDYLYVRSHYRDIPEIGNALEASKFFTRQALANWKRYDLLHKAELALLAHRNGDQAHTEELRVWLKKTASHSEENGMFWANNRQVASGFTSPVWTHCRLMELLYTLEPDTAQTDQLKQWLLNQKRTQDWGSTPATLNALHMLLLTGSDWLNTNNSCEVIWGTNHYGTAMGETATGYLKAKLPPASTNQQPNLIIRKTGKAPAWGALYTQYFQSMDQVSAKGQTLRVERKLFVETLSEGKREIRPLAADEKLQIGDKVTIRLVIHSDRDYQYVCLKDSRAGCFAPTQTRSGYERREGIGYYHSAKDASEMFFFEQLPQGTFVIEYTAYVAQSGEYAGGLSTIQCLYAPEFVAHSAGERIKVA